MQPIATAHIEERSDWIYEMKYDGFRAVINWTKEGITIQSRNKKSLTENFPEIISYCKKIEPQISSFLPVQLDGELVILNHPFQANFSAIQKRGRLKMKQKINAAAELRPATFIAFDLLQIKGKSYRNHPLIERKRLLQTFFNRIDSKWTDCLQIITTYASYEKLKQIIFDYKGEGIVAKRRRSKYIAGKTHGNWLKEKNWRIIYGFLTLYDSDNDYFQVAVYDEEEIISIGKCKHGLEEEVFHSLKQLFQTNGEKKATTYELPPAICVKLHTLDPHEGELREPEFVNVLPNMSPEECTVEKLSLDLAMLPDKVDRTNEDKIFWPAPRLTKGDLLTYMREIYPYLIPYVRNRALTVIRCPDGIHEESFFQKNLPNYAPDYIDLMEEEDKRIQLCNRLESLIWFANHGALEYHVPFQMIDSTFPTEIVFDLDPPTTEKFSLAIKAARLIKQLLDQLELQSFIKTSGNKGMQIHIPLPHDAVTYNQTAILTEAIAKTVEKEAPNVFTTERFKKNRGGRLYIDFVQHGKNKTIIAPYSPRKTEEATVATPLYWEEVKETLRPEQFTIKNVVNRVQTKGCPWLNHFEKARQENRMKTFKI